MSEEPKMDLQGNTFEGCGGVDAVPPTEAAPIGTAVPPADPSAPPAPATINLDELRVLVQNHLLVQELETCLKRAKATLAQYEARAQEQLELAGIKTMPISAPQGALRITPLAAGRFFVEVDVPAMKKEDFDAAELNAAIEYTITTALALVQHEQDSVDLRLLPGLHHLRPMNVTAASVLTLARLEGVEQERACEALQAAGFSDLVRPNYNAQTASSAARELLDQLAECSDPDVYASELSRKEREEAMQREKDLIASRIAALRRAFDFKTRVDMRVTRAGNKESGSARGIRALRKL